MGARRIRREQRQADMAESRSVNGVRKTKERALRETRMKEIIRQSKPPYTPVIMSWLSAQLDKPSRLITPAEVASTVVWLCAGDSAAITGQAISVSGGETW